MDRWPFQPQDQLIEGKLPDGSEARVRFNPMRQEWVGEDGTSVARPTHWREISARPTG